MNTNPPPAPPAKAGKKKEKMTDANPLEPAIESVRSALSDLSRWETLEELAAEKDRPDDVAALYREVLSTDLAPDLASDLGQRAVRFFEEWFGDSADDLAFVLTRVLERDPGNDWAFQRLTVAYTRNEQWDELLSVYDRAIAATKDREHRVRLLQEASDVAANFAHKPAAAASYMTELVALRPGDAPLLASLERLLEKEERWVDLIAIYQRRLASENAAQAHDTRVRIATLYLDTLNNPGDALVQAQALLESGDDSGDALKLLEQIADRNSAPVEVRRDALALLRTRYEAKGRSKDVVRALGSALEIADRDESITLRREAGEKLRAQGLFAEALDHYAELMRLSPSATDARDAVRDLSKRVGEPIRLATALETAATAAETSALRAGLRMEAADLRRGALADAPRAIELFKQIVEEKEVDAPVYLKAARRLAELLEGEGRPAERLVVLESLALKEPEAADRRIVRGQAARVADSLGEPDRALAAWTMRIEEDESDLEALDATVAILEREKRWDALIGALARRAAGPVPALQRRADMVRTAKIETEQLASPERAITTWTKVREGFGEDAEVVDALAALYAKTGAWEEVSKLLERAADRESTHVASVYTRFGDAEREHLGSPERALEAYRRALGIDPRFEGARTGLTALLSDAKCRGRAADALAMAYKATDDWRGTLSLLEDRLLAAEGPGTKVRLLREAAELSEHRAVEGVAALESMRRAMVLAPDDERLEAEVVRLADLTSRWDLATTAYAEASAAIASDPRRVRHLKREEARIAEQRSSDPARALSALSGVLAIEAGQRESVEAFIRLGALEKRPDDVAAVIVRAAHAHGELPSWLAEAAAAASHDAPEAMAKGLADAIAAQAGMRAQTARDLERLVARLYEEASDLDSAVAAYLRATKHDDAHVATYEDLGRLLRASPNKVLFDALFRLADLREDNLAVLREAAELAGTLGDEGVLRKALDRLYREAARQWKRGAPNGDHAAGPHATWAQERLVAMHESANEHEKAVQLLLDGAYLPVEPAVSREMRKRAAKFAAEKLADRPRAIVLYRGVLDETPNDEAVLWALGECCEAEDRIPEMLALRKHELSLSKDAERKLALRLDIARLVGELEKRGGRVDALKRNLDEAPGHAASIDAIVQVLEPARRFDELADLLAQQATRIEKDTDSKRAAPLWAKVASLAEDKLQDPDRALHAHRRVVELQPTSHALDALARLYSDRKDHGQAAQWLERRLASAEAGERVAIAMRLTTAYLGAKQPENAVGCLAAILADHPTATEVRDLLAQQYRAMKADAPLAKLLTSAGPHLHDSGEVLAYAREASELYQRLGTPELATPLLVRAVELDPSDRSIRLALATAYHAGGKQDEARALLEAIASEFGRRRNTERAAIHAMLADVLRAQGDVKGALEQLDLATAMDQSNAVTLRALGELSHEAGELERSERAYRALLLLVRRKAPEAGDPVGIAEVTYALHRLALERGRTDQAEELLRTALHTATRSDFEASRLKATLLPRKDMPVLLRMLEMRLETVEDPGERAQVLRDMADVFTTEGRDAQALDALLKAFELAPTHEGVHRALHAVSSRTGELDRYIDAVQSQAETLRRTDDKRLLSDLLMQLGHLLEHDRKDWAGASEAYRRVEQLGYRQVDARVAMARVAGEQGDVGTEVSLLEKLTADDTVPEAARTDAMFRLADVLLTHANRIEDGLDLLGRALEREPRVAGAAQMLKHASDENPGHEALLAKYEELARASGDSDLFVDFIEKRSAGGEVRLEDLRAAAELAMRKEGTERAEALFMRAALQAKAGLDGLAGALWAAQGLARIRKREGDVKGAVDWLREAANVVDGEEAVAQLLEAANVATEAKHDAAAAEVYEDLLSRDASDRRFWEPLLAIYRRTSEDDKLADLVSRTIDTLLDPADRNAVRLEHVKFLLTRKDRESEAAGVLKQILDEDPDHALGQSMLAELYERIGYDEDLAELLHRQFDAACDKDDVTAIRVTGGKLGKLLSTVRREDAMEIYRRAFNWVPDDREMAEGFLALHGPDDDAREKIETMERILRSEEGDAATELALRIADEWNAIGDEDGTRRTLESGYERSEGDARVRDRLEAFYRERGDHGALAELHTKEAAHAKSPDDAVALYRAAATLYLDELRNPSLAGGVLSKAWELAPGDSGLLAQLARVRAEAGEHEAAIEDVSVALSRGGMSSAQQIELLRTRATLHGAIENYAAEVQDLEGAYELDPKGNADGLLEGLEKLRDFAARASDRDVERTATLRLVVVLTAAGRADDAREALTGWVDRDSSDRMALHMLADMSEAAERWSAVAAACERLVYIEEGEGQVEAVIRLADACQKAGSAGAAREALEHVAQHQPDSGVVRARLREMYEVSGAHVELATLLLTAARQTDNVEERFELLRRVGQLYLASPEGIVNAAAVLEEASQLRPDDHETTVTLVDVYIATERFADAGERLEQAIAAHPRRRSPELAQLHQRMARLAGAAGDKQLQLQWLNAALDSDKGSAEIAAELALLAMELGDLDTALNALRVVTLAKTEGPMSRAQAFLLQAKIAYQRGEGRRATLWARKALSEDENFEDARKFLAELGET